MTRLVDSVDAVMDSSSRSRLSGQRTEVGRLLCTEMQRMGENSQSVWPLSSSTTVSSGRQVGGVGWKAFEWSNHCRLLSAGQWTVCCMQTGSQYTVVGHTQCLAFVDANHVPRTSPPTASLRYCYHRTTTLSGHASTLQSRSVAHDHCHTASQRVSQSARCMYEDECA